MSDLCRTYVGPLSDLCRTYVRLMSSLKTDLSRTSAIVISIIKNVFNFKLIYSVNNKFLNRNKKTKKDILKIITIKQDPYEKKICLDLRIISKKHIK